MTPTIRVVSTSASQPVGTINSFLSNYLTIPNPVAVCVAWVYNTEVEHAAHIEHIKEENGGELPETPAFDFMNRRSKPYPWGPNSLFFNPHVRYIFLLVG